MKPELLAPGWVYEGPDESVGLFGESVFHNCEYNEDTSAVMTDFEAWQVGTGRKRKEIQLSEYCCPVCLEKAVTRLELPDPQYAWE